MLWLKLIAIYLCELISFILQQNLMFGQTLWNMRLYGVWRKKAKLHHIFKHICFGDYAFSDVIISNLPNVFDGLDLRIETFDHSQHGQGFMNRTIKKKTFSVSWRIIAKNSLDLTKKINNLKGSLLKGQQILKIRLWDKVVYAKAVVTNILLPHHTRTRNAVAVEVSFAILSPFLYEEKISEQSFYDVKNSFYHTVTVYEGSYGSAIWLWIIFKQAPSIDTVLIWIWEKRLVIKHQFKKNDILHIDWENLNISCNWIYGIDWIGEFGELLFWQNEIRVFIDWERTADVFIQYRPTHV